jgi:hypothetical protein
LGSLSGRAVRAHSVHLVAQKRPIEATLGASETGLIVRVLSRPPRTLTGLPTFTGPSFGTLTTASNVARAAQVAIPTQDHQNKNDDKRSEQQDSNSAVQVLGAGNLSAQASNI